MTDLDDMEAWMQRSICDFIDKKSRAGTLVFILAETADQVLALIAECRLARTWLFSRAGSVTSVEAREAYREFLAAKGIKP